MTVETPLRPPGDLDPEAIGTVVPTGFQAYARILNPAELNARPIRWSELAAIDGRPFAGIEQWSSDSQCAGLESPSTGTIDALARDALVHLLRRFTADPDNCHFAIWEGYAGLNPPSPTRTLLYGNDRVVYQFDGPLSLGGSLPNSPRLGRGANCWWASDKTWWLGADIYSRSVLLGGTDDTIAAIEADDRLESYRVTAAHRLKTSAL